MALQAIVATQSGQVYQTISKTIKFDILQRFTSGKHSRQLLISPGVDITANLSQGVMLWLGSEDDWQEGELKRFIEAYSNVWRGN